MDRNAHLRLAKSLSISGANGSALLKLTEEGSRYLRNANYIQNSDSCSSKTGKDTTSPSTKKGSVQTTDDNVATLRTKKQTTSVALVKGKSHKENMLMGELENIMAPSQKMMK